MESGGQGIKHKVLPLHLKDVKPQITWESVNRLDLPEQLRTLARDSFAWTFDAALYDVRVGQRPPARSAIRFDAHDIATMIGHGKMRWGVPPERGGGANGFAREELVKERRRPIWEPFANDSIVSVPTIAFRSMEERHRRIAGARFAIARDYAAFYDQFPIAQSVSQLLGAPYGNKWIEPSTLPMGLRSSCAVAQVSTWCAVHDTEVGETQTETYIDNILFHGVSRDDVIASHQRFLARSEVMGAQLNPEGSVVATEFEFLGEFYDLARQTRTLSAKNKAKLAAVKRYLDSFGRTSEMSRREFAAIVGIGLYASRVLGRTAAVAPRTMRYFRQLMTATHWDEWQRSAHDLPGTVIAEAASWITGLLEAAPVPIWTERPPADATIIVDASEYGWGAICISATGVETVEARWTSDGHRYDLSVVAEPRAIWQAMCRFVRPEWRTLVVVTDHEPMILAADALVPKAYEYTEVLRKTSLCYPALQAYYVHVAGSDNPSDGGSRGRGFRVDDIERALEIAAAVADGGNGHGGKEYGPQEPAWLATAVNPHRYRE